MPFRQIAISELSVQKKKKVAVWLLCCRFDCKFDSKGFFCSELFVSNTKLRALCDSNRVLRSATYSVAEFSLWNFSISKVCHELPRCALQFLIFKLVRVFIQYFPSQLIQVYLMIKAKTSFFIKKLLINGRVELCHHLEFTRGFVSLLAANLNYSAEKMWEYARGIRVYIIRSWESNLAESSNMNH